MQREETNVCEDLDENPEGNKQFWRSRLDGRRILK
jgi:hypothetical protein